MAGKKPAEHNGLEHQVNDCCGVYGPETIQRTLEWLKEAMEKEDYSPENCTTPFEEVYENLQNEKKRLEKEQNPNNYTNR